MKKRQSPLSAGDSAIPVPCPTVISAPVPPKHAATVVSINEPSKVVPFSSTKPRFIVADERSNRTIFGIGSQRYALDFSTRITKLPPAMGDYPGPVLPIKKRQRSCPSNTKRDRSK